MALRIGMEPEVKFQKYLQNETVVVTGHTGFKGSWLTTWLKILGANVVGISLDPPTTPSHFIEAEVNEGIEDIRLNLSQRVEIKKIFQNVKPKYVFHLAAQSLVKASYDRPFDTWETNLMGTISVLEALKDLKHACYRVLITSDNCYDNMDWGWGYRETDKLGGIDPYSASKGATELAIRSYVHSFFSDPSCKVKISIARAGNVIGGGDWASDRIIPDAIRAWASGAELEIRFPNATRPWQHVLEPLSGYLLLATQLNSQPSLHGEPFNFGPTVGSEKRVIDLVEAMGHYWNKVKWKVVDNQTTHYESSLLRLNCDKALSYLKWTAVMDFENTVRMTSNWYKSYYENKSKIKDVTKSQIEEFYKLASRKGVVWA